MRHHPRHQRLPLALAVSALAACAASCLAAEPAASPGFRRDVMPIFFRAGCNGGNCHGSARGKDGYMLSLFGYDPAGDYRRTVEDIPGRRVNTAVPAESLLVLKATGAVPHTGGKLFDRDSDLSKTLLAWIAAGAPDDVGSVPEVTGIAMPKENVVFDRIGQQGTARVTATYSDGTQRDVTALARFFSNNPSIAEIDPQGRVTAKAAGETNVFARFNRFAVGAEVIVLLPGDSFAWPDPAVHTFIDEIVFDRLRKLRIAPSETCDDETFLRRVSLDLVARPPTVAEYKAFMADGAADKRARKVDELLATDAFTDFQAALWAERLRVSGGNQTALGTHLAAATTFHDWLREQFRTGRPLDAVIREMVAASGSNLNDPPTNLYTMLVHRGKIEPKALAADFSQLFLGVQIQCAECHNHPFDRWTMDDYYGFVSFFTGVSRKNTADPREKRIFFDPAVPPAVHLLHGRPMPATVLGGLEPVAASADPRATLADWLTSPANDLFARNLANRIWAQFFSRGIADPVDDVRVSNPPSNPRLLEALARRLVESGFDLRAVVRDICTSNVYQLSSHPNASNRLDTRQFSHAHLRRLRADVLADAIVTVTGLPKFYGSKPGSRAIDVFPRNHDSTEGPQYIDPFFHTFGASGRASVAVAETKADATLSQALHLAVGDTVRKRVLGSPVITDLMAAESTPEGVVERLFIRVLSRRPTPAEMEAARVELAAVLPDATAALSRSGGDRSAERHVYEDLFWALLNSSEFLFIR